MFLSLYIYTYNIIKSTVHIPLTEERNFLRFFILFSIFNKHMYMDCEVQKTFSYFLTIFFSKMSGKTFSCNCL